MMKNNYNIFKQASWSIVSRISTALFSFISISILLKILGVGQFGIWITISGLFAAFSFVDLGLANGLRNKLPKFENDTIKSKNLIVQTFILTIVIAIIAAIIFQALGGSAILIGFLKLEGNIVNLEEIINILFYLFIINLCVKPAHAVLQAEHKSHIVSLLLLALQALSTLGYGILYILEVDNSLYNVVLVYAITSVVIHSYICIYVIRTKIKNLMDISIPLYSVVDLLKSGLLFFVTALSYLSIFQIINILVIRNLGSDAAGEFGVYSKLFFAVNQIAVAGFVPIWSAFASANEKNDILWKKKVFFNIEKTILIVPVVLFIVFAGGQFIFEIWLGKDGFSYSHYLGALFSLLSMMIVTNTGYSYVLNGLNKLKIQLTLNIIFISIIFLMNHLDFFTTFDSILIVLICGFAIVNIFLRKKIKINL